MNCSLLSASAAPRPALGRLGLAGLVLLVVSGFGSAPCLANDDGSGIAVTGRIGTLGVGAEVAFGSGPLQVRAITGVLEIDRDVTVSDITYDGTLSLRHLGLVLDFHPGGGAFRLSGGAFYNDSSLEGTASINDLLREELGDDYPFILDNFDLGTLRGEARPEQIAPYAGIGWGSAPGSSGWAFTFDLGVLYLGTIDSELSVDTTVPIDLIPGGRALLDAAIEAEEREIEAEIADEDTDLYPVIGFGLSYRF